MGGESQAIVQSGSSSLSTAVAAPAAMPWALGYHPTFTAPATQDAQGRLTMAALDANEVVWLRAIQNLSSDQLGLQNNPVMAARFKAVMVLQAHELYDARKAWQLESNQVFVPIVLRVFLQGMINLMRDSDRINTVLTSAETLIYHYVLNPVIKFMRLKQKLFLGIDSGVTDAVIQYIEGSVNTPTERGVNQNEFMNAIARAITAEQLNQSINLQANAFNPGVLARDIANLQGLDVVSLCVEAGLTPAQAVPVQRLHESYLEMYRTHQAHCQDSVVNAQRVAPEFTEVMYSQCFDKAFRALGRQPREYLNNFIIELLLQQRRLPSIKAELLTLVTDVYLPTANTYYSSDGYAAPTLADYAATISGMSRPLPSLQETVAQAHAILHCDASVLALPDNADTVAQWAGHEALAAPDNSTGALMALAPAPLFSAGAPVPGQMTVEDTHSLSEEIVSIHLYSEHFKGFDKEPQYNPNRQSQKSRPEAVAKFNELLSGVTRLEDINALLTVAKPYINRHRNPIRDAIFGVNNTDTWRTCLKDARVKGLELLRNAQPTVEKLCAQRSTFLFASHRNESYLKGAWGRTSAQREIDGMIDEVKKASKPM